MTGVRRSPPPSAGATDVNAVASGRLRDLASIQTVKQKAMAYRRAADTIAELDQSITEVLRVDRTFATVAGIGPSSLRVLQEVAATGGSSTVDRLVAEAGKTSDVAHRRELQREVLSRVRVSEILAEPANGRVGRDDYRGDLQMHSEWSDGRPTLAQIVEGCLGRGYAYAAVTDHSHGLAIAGGLSAADVTAQHRQIDDLNRTYVGRFRLIKGIEANIGIDGRLDLTDDEAAAFELVLAAPHSNLRATEDQTGRVLAAVRHTHVRILGHPRGRVVGTRAGLVANWDLIFSAAATLGVAIELDGDPARQDLDAPMARRALKAGCLFAVDSDAHTIDQLSYADVALAHARLADIPPDRIVNCWPVKRLLAWLGRVDPRPPRAGRQRPARAR